MPRTLEAELLDILPLDSPDALRSRRDLLRVNHIMGNHAWFERVVPHLAEPGEHAIELGAGDGLLALRLRAAGLRTDALDRFPAPRRWPDTARWHAADLRCFRHWADYPIVIANLVLHHLDDAELAALGARLDRHARVLVFNEPLRRTRSRILWTLGAPLGGACAVTRHDGRLSIDAGFRDDELPRALRLDPARWEWRVGETFLGACRLVALRRP
jgi:hypothetical protein